MHVLLGANSVGFHIPVCFTSLLLALRLHWTGPKERIPTSVRPQVAPNPPLSEVCVSPRLHLSAMRCGTCSSVTVPHKDWGELRDGPFSHSTADKLQTLCCFVAFEKRLDVLLKQTVFRFDKNLGCSYHPHPPACHP